MADPVHSRAVAALARLAIPVLVVAVLDLASPVLLPMAVATLLSLVLVRLVNPLERLGLPRVPAVVLVAAVAFAALGGVGYVVLQQVNELAEQIPQYRHNIKQRIRALEGAGEGTALQKAAGVVEEIQSEIAQEAEQADSDEAAGPAPSPAAAPPELEEQPVPVEVRAPPPGPVQFLMDYARPLLNPLATAAIIVVFVIFMLVQRDDLRDRLLWLAGAGRLHIATRAIDEGAARVSRYLLMQLVVNLTYGIPVGLALWFIGLPGAFVWGFLAVVLRFIPYVGPWLAASMPILVSLAVFEGWTLPLAVVGMFIMLELFSNNVLEPWLYGASTGMSPMAVIVAAVFWSWLWGPIGLIVAVPLTACLVVIGRHIPQMRPLAVMLGDEPAFTPPQRLYERLLALDDDDAWHVATRFAREHGLLALFDDMLLPAVVQASRDAHRGLLDDDRQRFVRDAISEILDDVDEVEELPAEAPDQPQVLCVAPREFDALSARMLARALLGVGVRMEVLPTGTLASEMVQRVRDQAPAVVCVATAPPGGTARARYVSMRLKQHFPQVPVLVGLWTATQGLDRRTDRLQRSGARWVVAQLGEAIPRIRQALGASTPRNDHPVPTDS